MAWKKENRVFTYQRINKRINFILYPIYLLVKIFRFLNLLPKKYIIIGGANGVEFLDNSKYLFLYLHGKNRVVWVTHSKEVLKHLRKNDYRCYLSYSLSGVYHCLFARCFVVSHGVYDLIPVLMPGVSVVQLWHGIPIKKIGYDSDQWSSDGGNLHCVHHHMCRNRIYKAFRYVILN